MRSEAVLCRSAWTLFVLPAPLWACISACTFAQTVAAAVAPSAWSHPSSLGVGKVLIYSQHQSVICKASAVHLNDIYPTLYSDQCPANGAHSASVPSCQCSVVIQKLRTLSTLLMANNSARAQVRKSVFVCMRVFYPN